MIAIEQARVRGMRPNVLSIAGSDPSGGAGVQADIKTFAALGCHGMAVVAALTAQNSRGVLAMHTPPPEFVAAQIDALFDDIDIAAVKIGVLASAANVAIVADRLRARAPRFVVLDPVLAASGGGALGGEAVARAIVETMLPTVDLITPNVGEAARMTGLPEARDIAGLRQQGAALMALGARAVLMKGGHLAGDQAVDLLIDEAGERAFASPRVATNNTHGTGCALSSAIAARVALGDSTREAIRKSKDWLDGALRDDSELRVGHGPGPVNHFWRLWRRE